MRHISLPEATSTNTVAASLDVHAPFYVTAVSQTAGRGQRGNTWESEPGRNITMSIVLEPRHVAPRDQFAISRAVSLAVIGTLNARLKDVEKRAVIKWPNDIYVDDKKIAGILIEHAIDSQSIRRTIVGIGLNVNQEQFHSDAPNPASLIHYLHREIDVDTLASQIAQNVELMVAHIDNPLAYNEIYQTQLWRNSGTWPFLDTATQQRFNASIDHVAPDGRLHLLPSDCTPRRAYYFKEVTFLLV